jgi:hypothetical protein
MVDGNGRRRLALFGIFGPSRSVLYCFPFLSFYSQPLTRPAGGRFWARPSLFPKTKIQFRPGTTCHTPSPLFPNTRSVVGSSAPWLPPLALVWCNMICNCQLLYVVI